MRGRAYILTGGALYTAVRGLALPVFWVIFPLYLLSLGYRVEELGFIATASSLATALALPLIGYLIDSGHAPLIAAISASATTLSFMIPVAKPDIVGLTLAYVLSDLGMNSWYPARSAIVARIAGGKAVGRVVGIYVFLFNVVRVFSPVLAGTLAESVGYAEVMWLAGIISGAGFAVSLVLIVKPYYSIAGPSVEVPKGEWAVCPIMPLPKKIACIYAHGIRFEKRVAPLLLFAVLDKFAWMLWIPIQNAYLKSVAGFSDHDVGIYNSLMGASMLIVSYPGGWLTDRIGAFKTLALNEFLGAAGAIAITFHDPLLIYASSTLFGASIALWAPAYDAAAARILGTEHVGRVRSGIDTLRTIIGIPSPTAGSLLYTALGPASPFVASAILMVVATAPLRRTKKNRY